MHERGGKSLAMARHVVQWCAGTGQGVAVFSEEAKNRIMEEAARQGVQIQEPVVLNLKKEMPVRGVTFAGVIVDY